VVGAPVVGRRGMMTVRVPSLSTGWVGYNVVVGLGAVDNSLTICEL
jgi:hypothetical protein